VKDVGSTNRTSLPSRIAAENDLGGVAGTLRAAFEADPLWRWAFSDPAQLEVWWRFLVNSALRYPWVWIAGDYAAATVWIPPGQTELTEQEEARVKPLIDGLLGSRAPEVMELIARFGASHPAQQPHYYLSLFGTHPEAQGHGHGMGLLVENLATIDREGMPAYLESSNPANISRYERVGFVRVGEFSTPGEKHTVTTMWRDPR
jgi:ribosomal protein S18 acetylase RimI-like enzyme